MWDEQKGQDKDERSLQGLVYLVSYTPNVKSMVIFEAFEACGRVLQRLHLHLHEE
jgi:hypothetical protein